MAHGIRWLANFDRVWGKFSCLGEKLSITARKRTSWRFHRDLARLFATKKGRLAAWIYTLVGNLGRKEAARRSEDSIFGFCDVELCKGSSFVFVDPGEPSALDRRSCRCQRKAVGGADVSARPSKVQICRCQPQSRQHRPPRSMRICTHGESAYLRRLGSTGAQKLLESSPSGRFWIVLRWGKTAVWWRVFVVWIRCLYGNEWPEKATILTTGAFSKVVGSLTADQAAKRCRKNSDPAASQALLGSTFACPGEPSQSNKEASGQRDERSPSTAEHPDHDFVLSEPSLAVVMEQSLVPGWSAAVVIGDGGTSFAVLRVVVIALHAYEEHGGANFGW